MYDVWYSELKEFLYKDVEIYSFLQKAKSTTKQAS